MGDLQGFFFYAEYCEVSWPHVYMAVIRADTGFQRRGFEIRSAQGILLDGGLVASIPEKLTLKSLEIRFPVF